MLKQIFKVEIQLGNSAVEHAEDVAHLLDQVASQLRDNVTSGQCRDLNGNTVGRYYIEQVKQVQV